jgi:hypothetical protein
MIRDVLLPGPGNKAGVLFNKQYMQTITGAACG